MTTKNKSYLRLEKYRFKITSGQELENGKIEKNQVAGMATLVEGQKNYCLHLYMFQNDQFFLVPHKTNPSRFVIMTRRPWKEKEGKGKFSWNIVGHAIARGENSCVELKFDLLGRSLYMSMFPEESIQHRSNYRSVA
ncbi:MAG TPA: hypothetical protein VNJ08_10530 [Bacteriovoracaceae bacterium]|nr:hypothetical protein [Bacteriovoracaceae bacterium]